MGFNFRSLFRGIGRGIKVLLVGKVVERADIIHNDIELYEGRGISEVNQIFNKHINDINELRRETENTIKMMSKRCHGAVNRGTNEIIKQIEKV